METSTNSEKRSAGAPRVISFISSLSMLFGGALVLLAVLGALTSAYSRSLQPSLPYYVAAALGLGVLQIAAGFTLRSMRPPGFWVMISTTAVNAAASMIGLATGVQEVSGVVLSLMVNGVIAGYLASKRRLFGVRLSDRLG